MLLEQEATEETPNTNQVIGFKTAKLLLQQLAESWKHCNPSESIKADIDKLSCLVSTHMGVSQVTRAAFPSQMA